MNKHTILIVDDDVEVTRAIQRVLFVGGRGYNVLIATSGMRGLEIVQREKVSLVISDYKMPGMDGIEFLQRVKDGWQDTVRILLTASNEIGTAIQTVNSGLVYRFISKPWDNDELNKIVDGAIAFYDMVLGSKKLTGLTKLRTNS